jgi:hypothetical protein
MTIEGESPVTLIEGLGPATATRLAATGIHFVLDLLRLTPQALHSIVATTHSLEQVHHWRLMANLLEIEPMTPQWAEALVAAGVGTVEELSRRDLSWLAQAFAQAQSSGLIPDVPSSDQIGEMQRDATAVFYTGSLTGTVVDSNQAPVVGARVRLGFLETVTNSRGRFRLVRIPLGTTPPLEVLAPSLPPLSVAAPLITADPEAVVVQVFRLAPASANSTQSLSLSEFDGDLLPAMSGLPVKTEDQDPAQLRQGDIFMVQKFYKRTPDAMLVSRFRDFRAGEFVVRTARVPTANLPNGIAVKDHVTLRATAFEKVEFGPLKHQVALATRRFEKLHPQPTTTLSGAQHRARTLERLDYLKTEGILGIKPGAH